MAETNRWVVEGTLEGGLYIPEKDSKLPVKRGTVALTRYAIMEQNLQRHFTAWPQKMIYLGLEIPTVADHVCVAWQEMEAFVRALAIQKNVPITVRIIKMTNKPEEWPKGIEFLKARDFSICSGNWEPVVHHKDPKNRVRYSGSISTAATTVALGLTLEERHKDFSSHNKYQSELVKDYTAGLDVESRELSLAMLYYFKVLERIGKQEYGDPVKGAMKDSTLNAIITDLDAELTEDEKKRAKLINRWRHTKSEAHLITEGLPARAELELSKKLARLAILKKV